MKYSVSKLKVALFGDNALGVALPVVAAPTCTSMPLDGKSCFSGITTRVKTRPLHMLLLGVTTLGISAHPALADGTKVGSWGGPNFADHWYSAGWSADKEKGTTGIRSWSGTDTTFTGQGGWFSSTWTPGGGSWIPDISRGGPGFGALNKMVPNYSVGWTGNGIITPHKDFYTFGLKFNLANINGWKDYDMTTSYECYIVTHSNKPIDKRDGVKIGTVTTPGDPVPYDCYVFDAYWGAKNNGSEGKFKQLYAWRQKNSWSGPVNVQAILKFWEKKGGTSFKINTWYLPSGISIAPETFGTSGTILLENIRIPDLNTPLTAPIPTKQRKRRVTWNRVAAHGPMLKPTQHSVNTRFRRV